jgi:hypothetical protein
VIVIAVLPTHFEDFYSRMARSHGGALVGDLYQRFLIDHPHDLLAMRLQHFSLFWCGQSYFMRDAVAREHQFRVSGHRLIIEGICSECRSIKRPARKLDLV